MIGRYRHTAAAREHAEAILCGPVTYLPPPGGLCAFHTRGARRSASGAARGGDDEGAIASTDYALFWSLSFAMTATTWSAAGDSASASAAMAASTPISRNAPPRAGVPMRWVGGAHAFHQHHPVIDPFSISTTSRATPPPFTSDGAGGRWRAG